MFNFGKNKSFYKYQTRDLSLILEKGWNQYRFDDEKINDPLTFVKTEEGVGSLQISLITGEKGETERFNIEHFLIKNNYQPSSEIKKYKTRDWEVYEYESFNHGTFCKFFNMVKLNVIIFATYNCEIKQLKKSEVNEAIKIIKSIEVSIKK